VDVAREGATSRAPRAPRRGFRWGQVWGSGTWRRPTWRWLAALVALSALANLVVLLLQARSFIRSLYLNADNANAFVLPALRDHVPAGAVVNLGDHPWYEPWWYMRATAGLPHYHQLWEIAPIVLGLLGIVAVAACAWRALGALAGLLCGAVLVAVSETLRDDLYAPEAHGLVVLHLGVLCGALLLVLAWARAKRLTPTRLLLLGVPFVLFTGAGLTDQLLLVSGLGPFVLAPLLCWWRLRTRVWLAVTGFAVGTAVLSGLLALELAQAMQEQHVVHAPFPISFVATGAIVGGFENLFAALLALGGGSFLGGPVSGENLFAFLAGVLVLFALMFVVRALWHWVHRPASRAAASTARDVAPPAPGLPARDAEPPARELFIAFWGLVFVCVVAAFVLTQLSGESGNTRYLIGAWAALAALLGILVTSPPARAALLVGVAAFGALNVRAELAGGVPPVGPAPGLRIAGEIERFAAAHGASVGYSGYWDSAPVTWETHERVQINPIEPCGAGAGECVFYGNQISSWYTPRPHTHTFLLTDSRPGDPLAVPLPPAGFGQPIAGESLGEGFTIFVYGRDIASSVSP
jgi:hypothetical protein